METAGDEWLKPFRKLESEKQQVLTFQPILVVDSPQHWLIGPDDSGRHPLRHVEFSAYRVFHSACRATFPQPNFHFLSWTPVLLLGSLHNEDNSEHFSKPDNDSLDTQEGCYPPCLLHLRVFLERGRHIGDRPGPALKLLFDIPDKKQAPLRHIPFD